MHSSIIIPSYDYARYLGEAIESALGQSRRADEIIVVDDGSTDDSLRVARSYPVDVIERPHSGAPETMAHGVAASTGECFVILGADDRLAPDYLAKTVPVLESDPQVGFVYTAVELFGSVQQHRPARPFSLARILAANYASGAALTRRAAYDQTGGYGSIQLAKYEDWHLFLSMLEHGWHAVPTNDTTLYYRQHGQSRNQTPGIEHERAIQAIMEDHPRLYRPSPRLWYALHRSLFRRFPRAYVGLLMLACALPRGTAG